MAPAPQVSAPRSRQLAPGPPRAAARDACVPGLPCPTAGGTGRAGTARGQQCRGQPRLSASPVRPHLPAGGEKYAPGVRGWGVYRGIGQSPHTRPRRFGTSPARFSPDQPPRPHRGALRQHPSAASHNQHTNPRPTPMVRLLRRPVSQERRDGAPLHWGRKGIASRHALFPWMTLTTTRGCPQRPGSAARRTTGHWCGREFHDDSTYGGSSERYPGSRRPRRPFDGVGVPGENSSGLRNRR